MMMADTQLPLWATRPNLFQLVADLRGIAPIRRAVAGRCRFTSCLPKAGAAFYQAVRKGHVMSKPENDANNIFRPSDSPLTEYEKEANCPAQKSGTAEGRTIGKRGCQCRSFTRTKRPSERPTVLSFR